MSDKKVVLNALKRVLASQFEEVIFHADIPSDNIAPGAQAARALELIKYAEGNRKLADLERAIQTVAPGVLKACQEETPPAATPVASTAAPALAGEEMQTDETPPKVFISYSHDSPEHRDFVLRLANHLREDGIDCNIDQYLNGAPPDGWPLWMEKQIERANFVLVMCTPTYWQRFRRETEEGGRGVAFEGLIITQTLYNHYFRNTKFLPLIPDNGNAQQDVPLPLQGYNTYRMFSDYERLYRVLTGQPEVAVPILGKRKALLPRNPN